MPIHETVIAIALGGGAMLLPPDALANHASCARLADQAVTALSSNTTSPNYNKAKAHANNGYAACAADNFDMGVSYYREALDLLARK